MSALADADVEGLARALGVYGFDATRPSVSNTDGYGWSVQPKGGTAVNIDAVSLALLLLGHARGMRLDIGECPSTRPPHARA